MDRLVTVSFEVLAGLLLLGLFYANTAWIASRGLTAAMRAGRVVKRTRAFFGFFCVVFFLGVGLRSFLGWAEGPDRKIQCVVSLSPLKNFVKDIGGDRVEVKILIPPGANPHTYELKPSQLKEIENADLLVKVGSGIEFELAWLDKLLALNKKMLVVDGSRGIDFLDMHGCDPESGACAESVGHHSPQGRDPHIWLSPQNAKIIAGNILEGFATIDPLHKDFYEINKGTLVGRLDQLSSEIRNAFTGFRTNKFIVFHPAWGYFARDFGLEQVPIEFGGKEPSAQQLAAVIDQAKKLQIKAIFASPQFSRKSADVIAREIQGTVIFINPVAEDYLENLKQVAEAIRKNS
ncbi:MAG: zinc ABC transporter substrate-binding protein [Candidatus Omnitrophica bacterium]|nr:zinc ABC transporter substrate-binding protein [Candidatus Omnitrophota bacterium]